MGGQRASQPRGSGKRSPPAFRVLSATQQALTEAAKTVRNIQTIYIKEFQAIVENNRIVNYRINAKISFIVEGT